MRTLFILGVFVPKLPIYCIVGSWWFRGFFLGLSRLFLFYVRLFEAFSCGLMRSQGAIRLRQGHYCETIHFRLMHLSTLHCILFSLLVWTFLESLQRLCDPCEMAQVSLAKKNWPLKCRSYRQVNVKVESISWKMLSPTTSGPIWEINSEKKCRKN